MNIQVNGKPIQLEAEQPNIDQLLDHLGYQNRFVAVARNQVCVPKSQYLNTIVVENDDIENLAPMSGG